MKANGTRSGPGRNQKHLTHPQGRAGPQTHGDNVLKPVVVQGTKVHKGKNRDVWTSLSHI